LAEKSKKFAGAVCRPGPEYTIDGRKRGLNAGIKGQVTELPKARRFVGA